MFYNAISAKYPSIQVISSTTALTPQPGNTAGDYHDYAVSLIETIRSDIFLQNSTDSGHVRTSFYPI